MTPTVRKGGAMSRCGGPTTSITDTTPQPSPGCRQETWQRFPRKTTYSAVIRLAAAVLALVGLAGCGVTHVTEQSVTVHDVHIRQEVTPRMLFARRGDQIRWHNLLPSPVQIGILGTRWQDHVVCEKGFKRFGQMEDLVTIQPQEYVSLCFSQVGTVQYNVWLDPKNLTGSMSPTATIRID